MLALICGAGDLPGAVARAASAPPLVCALRGYAPRGLAPEITFRIETLGSLIAMLRARGVTQACFCGHIRRPEVDLGAVDDATLPYLPRFRDALALGDDGALRVILGIFAEAGFGIVGAHEAAPSLLPEPGVPSRADRGPDVAQEALLGDAALEQMAEADLGQACIIRHGRVIAREGRDGTDALLASLRQAPETSGDDPVSWLMDGADALLGQAADWLSNADALGTGFLYKAPKPGQDRRIDLPVIGPGTVRGVAAAGLSGIVIEAGGVMVLHRDRVLDALDAAELFLWVREKPA